MGKRPAALFLYPALLALALGGIAIGQDAAYVGSERCKECHADYAKAFTTNIHSKASAYGMNDQGCETCHGPGSGHVASGDKTAILNPAKIDVEGSSEKCLQCHAKDKPLMFWKGSIHPGNHLGCVACHQVHTTADNLLKRADEKELCFACHAEVRADMLKRSKHPMRDSSSPSAEGKMNCTSCHNPHGARAERLVDAKSFNDKCYECHFEKRAPLLWEHSPVKEDCITCHTPHGSSNDKMLVTKVPRLCQQCHLQGRHQSGALGTNSTYVFNRSCLNCHPMVHGSNNPSGPVLQR